MEGRLKAGHRVECHAHGPDVAPLIVALLLDDFRRETQRCPDNLLRLYVAMVVEHPRL